MREYSTATGKYGIYYLKYNAASGTWDPTSTKITSEGTSDHYSPRIAVDSQNNLHVVWLENPSSNYFRVKYIKYNSATAKWEQERFISDTTTIWRAEQTIAVGPSGNIYVAWVENVSGNVQILFRKCVSGAWGAISTVPTANPSRTPCLTSDQSGTIYLVFNNYIGGNYGHVYLKKYNGSWGNDIEVSTINSYGAEIAIDVVNNAHIVWNSSNDIYYREYFINSDSLGPQTNLVADPNSQRLPRVCSDINGSSYVIWEDQRDSANYYLYWQKYSANSPPTGLTAEAGDSSVTLSWDPPETADLVQAYKIFDGYSDQLIAEIPKQDTSFIVSGLNNGSSYSFYVKAKYNGLPDSAPSNYAEATPYEAPATPEGLCVESVDAVNGTVQLKWVRDAAYSISGYYLYEKMSEPPTKGAYDKRVLVPQPSEYESDGFVHYTVTGLTLSNVYYYSVSANDYADHESELSNCVSTSDTTPPTMPSPISPANNAWQITSSITFEWTQSTDNVNATDTGVKGYNLYIDGTKANATPISQTSYTAVLTEGSHTWCVEAIDNADNVSGPSATWTTKIDLTAPAAFNLVSPSDAAVLSSQTVTLSWETSTDVLSGIKEYALYLNGSLDRTTANLSVPLTLDDGDYSWLIKARDNAGNETPSAIWNFTINQGGPIITVLIDGVDFSSVPPGTVNAISEKPKLEITIRDGNGVRSGVVKIDGATQSVTPSGNPGDVEWLLGEQMSQPLSEGNHIITIEAADINDKISSKTINVKVFIGDPEVIDDSLYSYPNPFDPEKGVTIHYSLSAPADIKILMYNSTGKLVRSIACKEGEQGGLINDNNVFWDGEDNFKRAVANGPYFYFIIVDGKIIGKGEMAAFR